MNNAAENPYVGLRAFEAGDRGRFFGRTDEQRELVALWLSHRLVVLYGPSGVGKTSLIQAGAVPEVGADVDALPVGRAAPSSFSSSSLPMAESPRSNPYVQALLSTWFADQPPIRLAGRSVTEGLFRWPRRTDRHAEPLPILAAIDQFEEVLADPPPWAVHRQEFLAQLADALKEFPSLRLLIALREEFLPEMLKYEPELAGHSRARLSLRPMGPEAALAAVTGPLTGTGRSYAPGVAERLVDDLRTVELTGPLGRRVAVVEETVQPWQLQVVCAALWSRLSAETGTITEDLLFGPGDVGGLLAGYCDQIVAETARARELSPTRIWQWLRDEFITELGTRSSVYRGFSETGGLPNAVAQDLARARILRAERRAGAYWYELSHDRLVQLLRPGLTPRRPDTPEPGAPEYLRAARGALAEGELTLAADHAATALRTATDEEARDQAEGEVLLAGIAAQRDQIDEAIRRYERAAELFEALAAVGAVARCLLAMGRLRLRRGEHAEAITELQGALERVPGDPELRAELAAALWEVGQPGAAAAIFAGVLEIEHDHPEALAGHAQILADRGDDYAALEELDRLRRRHPDMANRPEARAARAVALAGAGRTDEARDELAASVASGRPTGMVLWRAARVAIAAGDAAQARLYLRRALDAPVALFPHAFTAARDMLRSLETHS